MPALSAIVCPHSQRGRDARQYFFFRTVFQVFQVPAAASEIPPGLCPCGCMPARANLHMKRQNG
ncbi:MAG: hypothetical protein C0510_07980 [Erythrobacter sp.]|nr:hypothetical protein [Erythrobacter sp.]